MRTTEQIRIELGVSSATITNWVKTGIIPPYPNGRFFDDSTYEDVLGAIKNDHKKLQKRANRSNNQSSIISPSTIANSGAKGTIELLSRIYQESKATLSEFMFSLSVYFLKKKGLAEIGETGFHTSNTSFTAFLDNWKFTGANDLVKKFDQIDFRNNEVDFLGSTYESLRALNEKSIFGAFFTPVELIADIEIPIDATVLDPCGGTGTFLLGIIKKGHDPQKITIRDIDELALNIAKVNFALFFNSVDSPVKIEARNILFDRTADEANDLFSTKKEKECFDIIATNPPFGAKLTTEEKASLINGCPTLKTTESSSIVLFNCLNKMGNKGKLFFILPESLLYVDTHFSIRKHVFNSGKNIKIRHLGNAFKGIMSKIIRLEIENGTTANVAVFNKNFGGKVNLDLLTKNAFRPPYVSDACEIEILDKILAVDFTTLDGKCKFGLGVVTGNNEAFLKTSHIAGLEPILTGKELKPFKFAQPKYFIDLVPNGLQQVAPVELYRQPKICYRFISDSVVTVADFDGVLLLNSINFFIPDKKFPIKALSAFLNSGVVTFIYKRLYNSTKVLRNHLESMPIPVLFFENIERLTELYDQGNIGQPNMMELNSLVCSLYGLGEAESNYILKNA